MKSDRDNKEFCAAIFTDLSKAFDCIIVKLMDSIEEHRSLSMITLVIDYKKLLRLVVI